MPTEHKVSQGEGLTRIALAYRLCNLGFYNGYIDGKWNGQLIAAVKALQFQCALTQSGKLDAATQAALEKAFGS